MNNLTPYGKLSKKRKRELDDKNRITWSINPVTRRAENPKAYKRAKHKSRSGYDEYGSGICIFS